MGLNYDKIRLIYLSYLIVRGPLCTGYFHGISPTITATISDFDEIFRSCSTRRCKTFCRISFSKFFNKHVHIMDAKFYAKSKTCKKLGRSKNLSFHKNQIMFQGYISTIHRFDAHSPSYILHTRQFTFHNPLTML